MRRISMPMATDHVHGQRSYEQFTVDRDGIGDSAAFLQDAQTVTAELIDGALPASACSM